eukprot:2318227-Rhodomonas_salina.4
MSVAAGPNARKCRRARYQGQIRAIARPVVKPDDGQTRWFKEGGLRDEVEDEAREDGGHRTHAPLHRPAT